MRNKYLLLIIALLVIVIFVMAIAMLNGENTQSSHMHQGIVYEPISKPKEQAQAATSLPGIAIPGWSAMKLPAGKTTATVSLHNPEENTGYYDLQFTLIIKETGEVIFETGLVQPGNQCSSVELLRELVAGEYDAILFIQPYTQESHTKTNNAELDIKLIVQ